MTTSITKNFLSDEEIFDIEYIFRNRADTRIQIEQHLVRMSDSENIRNIANIEARSHYWYPGSSYFNEINSLMNNKVRNLLGDDNIFCDNWHILNAYKPYTIHSDSYDITDPIATSLPAGRDYAYTFLIPLETYMSNTIIFKEKSYNCKVAYTWIEINNAQKKYKISKEDYEKYFTHDDENLMDYFEIETVFPWIKGDLLIMSSHSFHCSDNFPKKKILEKRALIGWSNKKVI